MTIHLLCHVERLPDYGTGDAYFSMNLTVGFAADPGTLPSDPQKLKLISPWEWTLDPYIDVQIETGGVLGPTVQAQRVGTVPVDQHGPFAKQLASIRDEFAAKQDSKNFVWLPDAASLQREAEDLRWYDFLIQASTYPAALAHSAGISFIFSVANLDPTATRIVAAPRVDLGAGVRKPMGAPVRIKMGNKPADDPPLFHAWTYDADVVAYQRECLLLQSDIAAGDDQFLDTTSGWVTGGTGTVAEDWALQLEARLSEAFDLSMRLIETLRAAVAAKTFVIDATNRDAVVNVVTAAMHDIAATGVRRAASATGVAPDFLEHLKEELKAAGMTPIDANLKGFEAALNGTMWQPLLAAATGSKLFEKVEISPNGPKVPAISDDRVLDELARMHGALGDEATLRELLLAQWDLALAADPQLGALRNAKSRLMRDVLPAFKLRKTFLLDVLEEGWPAFSRFSKAVTRDEQVVMLQKNLGDALKSYCRDRFDDANGMYRGFLPRGVSLPPAVAAIVMPALQDFANRFVEPPKPQNPAERQPPPLVPHGRPDHDALIIQLADVHRASDESLPDDQNSSARRISGYGMLLRRTGGDWRCLNYANVCPYESDTPLADPLIVPLRLGFRNGVRQTFVAYENTPLVAESPFLDLLRAKNGLGDTLKLSKERDPLFVYRNAYGPNANQPKLVPLVYGGEYQAAAFAIGTAGTLPRGLAKATTQGGKTIVDPIVPDLVNAKPDGIRTLTFRRRTPIGAPRYSSPNAKPTSALDPLPLPVVPDTVQPLARSLPGLNGAASGAPRPLLFLRTRESAASHFSFALRPPSIDIQTWDRWVAVDASQTTRDQRVKVWGRYHEIANSRDAGEGLPSDAARGDLSLDDPAVGGWLVRLTRRYPSPASSEEKWISKLESATVTDLLDVARHAPLLVTVKAKRGGTLDFPQPTAEKCDVTIPDGQVWTLEVFPAVRDGDVAGRFASDVKPEHASNGWSLFAPFALDIETTPDALGITAQELFDGLTVTTEGSASVSIALDPTKMPSAAWLRRMDVVVQQWRWSGRPLVRPRRTGPKKWELVSGFPDHTPDHNDDAVLFADRAPSDALVVPASVDFVARPGITELHRRDVRNTPGALYFRIAVRAFSRYEGVDVGGVTSNDSRAAAFPEAWYRHVVLGRWEAEVPPPVVKLVVPLTRPIGQDLTPPLLVVLDEQWGEVGGFGETITAEIVSVDRTNHPVVEAALPVTSLPELGPDPILSVQRNPAVVVPQAPIGPIGYTFDTDTDAPLFVKSSFLLPPPTGMGDLSWYFVKLRFRREIDGTWHKGKQTLRSEPTQPVWAQYLPPSTRFGSVDVTTLTLHVDTTTNQGSFRDPAGKTVTLAPTAAPGSKSLFELWILVTNGIEDASGRADQEIAVGMPVRLTGDAFVMQGNLAAPRVRVVEIQRRAGVTSDGFWKDLFRDEESEDAKARIVRVSPPIVPSLTN